VVVDRLQQHWADSDNLQVEEVEYMDHPEGVHSVELPDLPELLVQFLNHIAGKRHLLQSVMFHIEDKISYCMF
jgi:hypothetical protein